MLNIYLKQQAADHYYATPTLHLEFALLLRLSNFGKFFSTVRFHEICKFSAFHIVVEMH
jgi:hypothetical protein